MNLDSFIREGILVPFGKDINQPTSLFIDSRKVEKGGLFIAIPGSQQDGAAFIEEALKKGANAIVMPQGIAANVVSSYQDRYPKVSFFGTDEVRKTASLLASHFYPLQPETIVAVTGTNGKTSVVSFIRQIWHQLGIPAASLGTLGLVLEGKPFPPPEGTEGLNTPDSVSLHQILQTLKNEKIDHLAFEASSHGLHQHRMDHVHLRAAVFTNLTQDHLDYHHSLEAYFDAKIRLFQELMYPNTCAILNAESAEYKRLLAVCQNRGLQTLTYGKGGKEIQLISTTPHADSQEIVLHINGNPCHFTLPLVGEFQVYNVMAALGAVITCGAKLSSAVNACIHLKGVPGRLERAAPGVYVDYAHTPDSLSVALKSLRAHTKGHLWVVFGCGGNRDQGKRPLMGEIASGLADRVIITDDNPRQEDPSEIRKQILAKCPQAQEVPSRAQAIITAIENMEEGDTLLIAGKGHERYQLIGEQILPFNDVEEVRKWGKG